MRRRMPPPSATCSPASRDPSATSCCSTPPRRCIVGGKVASLADGVERASRSIDTGAAAQALDKLVAITNAA